MLVPQTGNEKPHASHLGQPDDLGAGPKPFFLRCPYPLVRKLPLGQKMDSDLDMVAIDVTVLFEGRQENPARLLNGVEDRSAGIPGIYHDGQASWEKEESFLEDFQGEGDFAFESARLRDLPGPVAANGKDKTQSSGFQKSRHRTQTFLKSLGRVMEPQTFDLAAFPRGQGIVENQKGVFEPFPEGLTKSLKLFLKLCLLYTSPSPRD